jgi:TRAP-type C4-dicarboxylate transport system substrate-binding protein
MIKMGIKLFLSIVLVVALTAQVYAASQERWKIGHLRQSGSAIDKDLHKLIDDISQETENRRAFDVYSGNRLGDYSIVQERVSFGEVQLYVGPLATSIDKRLLVATTPYLVNSWNEAREVYHQGSPLLQKIGKYLAEQNIKLLGGWPVYFGGIGLREQPIAPENPDIKKEMIIRVPPIRTFELTAKELGYTPYPITWTYATMGLKTGMVDGILGGGAEGYSNFSDRIKYYIPVRDHFEYWFIYMNSDSWKTLTANEQNVFLKAVAQMEETRYHIAENQEKESIEDLRQRGVNIIDLSEHQLQTMQEKIRKNVWPLIRKEVGPEFDGITPDIAGE